MAKMKKGFPMIAKKNQGKFLPIVRLQNGGPPGPPSFSLAAMLAANGAFPRDYRAAVRNPARTSRRSGVKKLR